jgi:hypothetical protein
LLLAISGFVEFNSWTCCPRLPKSHRVFVCSGENSLRSHSHKCHVKMARALLCNFVYRFSCNRVVVNVVTYLYLQFTKKRSSYLRNQMHDSSFVSKSKCLFPEASTVHIETSRLILRPFRLDDGAQLFEAFSDSEVCAMIIPRTLLIYLLIDFLFFSQFVLFICLFTFR